MAILECVGVAGSGKTFAADALVGYLDGQGIQTINAMRRFGPSVHKATRVRRKCVCAAVETIRDPIAIYLVLLAVKQSRQTSRRDALSLVSKLVLLRALSRPGRTSDAVIIFDQGALMAIWSSALNGVEQPCRELFRRSSWRWVLPDQVLQVGASSELIEKHLGQRITRQSRLEILGGAQRETAIREGHQLISELVRWWEAENIENNQKRVTIWNEGTADFTQKLQAFALDLRDNRCQAPLAEARQGIDGTGAA